MNASTPPISETVRRRVRHSRLLRHRACANLPDAPGARDCRLCRRRGVGHRGPADWTTAFRAARSIIRHREPPGSRQQSRHRDRRACAARRPYAAPRQREQCNQRHALRQAELQLHPRHRSGREHHPRAARDAGQSLVSRDDGCRIHRICEGQSRSGQHGVGGQWEARSISRASCSVPWRGSKCCTCRIAARRPR